MLLIFYLYCVTSFKNALLLLNRHFSVINILPALLLKSVSCIFQVVIFVKSVQRCTALAQLLTEQNFPAIAIHRGMTQEERLSRYQQFKDFQKVSSPTNSANLLIPVHQS